MITQKTFPKLSATYQKASSAANSITTHIRDFKRTLDLIELGQSTPSRQKLALGANELATLLKLDIEYLCSLTKDLY